MSLALKLSDPVIIRCVKNNSNYELFIFLTRICLKLKHFGQICLEVELKSKNCCTIKLSKRFYF